jgi:hypothetical protein
LGYILFLISTNVLFSNLSADLPTANFAPQKLKN